MTREECLKLRKAKSNLAWYLGVDLEIKECNLKNCPEGGCSLLKSATRELASSLLDHTVTKEQIENVRAKRINFGAYSYFEADE